ncbi:MAG TPA: hypothetical protein VIG38_02020 [Hyphomicrobium sp.]|jgi:hypothetical protein
MRITSSAARCVGAIVMSIAVSATSLGAKAEPVNSRLCGGTDFNAMVLDIIKDLPKGGGYSLGSSFQLPTITAHNIGGNRMEMRVYDGSPSHCTSATYTVFARLVAVLQDNGTISLTAEQIAALDARSRMPDGTTLVDGQGLFQIFNANGAGVAALLKHTGTGMNFRDDNLLHARAGDFLKLFWNDNVGASEKGHQVIYLGHKTVGSRDMLCFWSSQRQNKKKRSGGTEALYFPAQEGDQVVDGYGEVCRPRSDVKEMIFSRITCMQHLAAGLDNMRDKAIASRGAPSPFVDDFLYKLRESSSDQATLDRMYDILAAPDMIANLTREPGE